MEFKLKLYNIISIKEILMSIVDNSEIKLDVLLKFKMLSIIYALNPYTTNFDIVRNEKIMEYGEETEDGMYKIPKDDIESVKKFHESLEEVLNADVTINIDPIKPEEIIDKGLNSDYLTRLFPIIKQY